MGSLSLLSIILGRAVFLWRNAVHRSAISSEKPIDSDVVTYAVPADKLETITRRIAKQIIKNSPGLVTLLK
ncbi:MAG: hypothetical protein ACP5VS_06350 [Desulfomonilaceae bacterium]